MKNTQRIIVICCLILLTGAFGFRAQAQTLHAFVVIEGGAPGAAKDKIIMTQEIQRIARLTGMTARTYTYKRNQRGLISRMRSLNPSGNDVILFYYSGHGANSGNGWPVFGNQGDGLSFKQTRVRELLSSKPARLKITLYDCCNGGRTIAPYRPIAKAKPSLAHVYNLLFKKFKGEVMACASASGNLAYGDNNSGSYFTLGMIDAFTKIPLGANAWNELARKTIGNTNELCTQVNKKRQTPKFYVNVKYTGSNGIRAHAAPDKIVIGRDGFDFDNLYQIVERFKNDPAHGDISVQKLKEWNKLQSLKVSRGQEINLVKPLKDF